jgi:hypothetical protein
MVKQITIKNKNMNITQEPKHIVNKTWFHNGVSGFSLAALMTRLKNAIKLEIPAGYQDETGFHTGVKADEKDLKRPATW